MVRTNLSLFDNFNQLTPYAVGFDRVFDQLQNYVENNSTSTGYATIHSDLASVGKIYASADTIDIKVLGAQDTSSKVRAWAVVCDISGIDETDRN